MKKLTFRHIVETYYSYYVIFIVCLWAATLFLPWDIQLGTVLLYPFILQKLFPVLGASLILISVMLKKISIFILGVALILAFWINLWLLFAIFLVLFGN